MWTRHASTNVLMGSGVENLNGEVDPLFEGNALHRGRAQIPDGLAPATSGAPVACAACPRGSPLPSEDVGARTVRRIHQTIAANAIASLHLQAVRRRSSVAEVCGLSPWRASSNRASVEPSEEPANLLLPLNVGDEFLEEHQCQLCKLHGTLWLHFVSRHRLSERLGEFGELEWSCLLELERNLLGDVMNVFMKRRLLAHGRRPTGLHRADGLFLDMGGCDYRSVIHGRRLSRTYAATFARDGADADARMRRQLDASVQDRIGGSAGATIPPDTVEGFANRWRPRRLASAL